MDDHSDDNVYTVTLECPHIDPLVMAIDNLASMQYSGPKLRPIIDYLNLRTLPSTKKDIHKLLAMAENYTLIDGILHHFHKSRAKSSTM